MASARSVATSQLSSAAANGSASFSTTDSGKITVRRDIHAVASDFGEIEVARNCFAVMREAAAGERPGAEGHHVRAPAGFAETLIIAGEHFEVSEKVVGPEHGLGATQMGITR